MVTISGVLSETARSTRTEKPMGYLFLTNKRRKTLSGLSTNQQDSTHVTLGMLKLTERVPSLETMRKSSQLRHYFVRMASVRTMSMSEASKQILVI